MHALFACDDTIQNNTVCSLLLYVRLYRKWICQINVSYFIQHMFHRKCYSLMWMNNTKLERMLVVGWCPIQSWWWWLQSNAETTTTTTTTTKKKSQLLESNWFWNTFIYIQHVFFENTLHMLAVVVAIVYPFSFFLSIKCDTKCWIFFTSTTYNYTTTLFFYISKSILILIQQNIFILSAKQIE